MGDRMAHNSYKARRDGVDDGAAWLMGVAIVCGSVLVLVLGVVFFSQVNSEDHAAATAKTQVARLSACKTLPVADRNLCINVPGPKPLVGKNEVAWSLAANTCDKLSNDNTEGYGDCMKQAGYAA